MKHGCKLSVTRIHDLCSELKTIYIMDKDIMDKEKAVKIQRYYNLFRLVVILMFVGLLLYLTK